jgi:hypothetical protein
MPLSDMTDLHYGACYEPISGAGVAGYRAYVLDIDGRVQACHRFEAVDDLAAVSHARQWLDRDDVEVWRFDRTVAKLTYGGSPGSVRIIWPQGQSDHPLAPRQTRPCRECGLAMRMVRTEPHSRYTNLDEWFFECACGENLSEIIASC